MGSSSLTPESGPLEERLSTEIPRPEAEVNEEMELERRVWPLVEKMEAAGETGAEELADIGD